MLRGETISFLDATVDLLFLIDIVIKFRTSYLDPKQSIEVKDPIVIGKKYLFSVSFVIDFISSVPFNSLLPTSGNSFMSTFFELLGLLKLLRLNRLYLTVQRLDAE